MSKKSKITIYDINENNYPEKLKSIKNPPKKLYVLGNLPDENKKTVAIVGSRACSDYGNTMAKLIAKTLSQNDIQVISGLALGIDTAAHIGSLETNGKTFAVLGCGVNICYPSYNFNIYERILETNGGIISELEKDKEPLPFNFPLRNRIISGLSDLVIIVEADKKSGALITADYAIEQGKDVFCVPGRLGDRLSLGTNKYIKDGAYIITEISDILDRLGVIKDKKIPIDSFNIDNLDYFEKTVFSTLSYEAKHFDEIMAETKLPYEKLTNVLMSLQLSNVIKSTGINYFKKCK